MLIRLELIASSATLWSASFQQSQTPAEAKLKCNVRLISSNSIKEVKFTTSMRNKILINESVNSKPFSQSSLSIIEADLSLLQVTFQKHLQHAPRMS